MKKGTITAASYVGPDGWGNDLKPIQPWADELADRLKQEGAAGLHWNDLFQEEAPRFARMDAFCRIGVMAVELLQADLVGRSDDARERLGVFLESHTGSLATDIQFLKTPRPSIFTYTLPSTVIGEVCIRYRLKGPVLCLMDSAEAGSAVVDGADRCLAEGDAGACLCLRCEVPVPLPGRSPLATAETGRDEPDWYAVAALIEPGSGASREYPLLPGSLLDICRSLCTQSKGS